MSDSDIFILLNLLNKNTPRNPFRKPGGADILKTITPIV